MKRRDGNEMRDLSGGGDVKLQRLKDLPFPRSEVIELGLGKNDISKFLDKEEQAQHDGWRRPR